MVDSSLLMPGPCLVVQSALLQYQGSIREHCPSGSVVPATAISMSVRLLLLVLQILQACVHTSRSAAA